MGLDGVELSCPGSSVVVELDKEQGINLRYPRHVPRI
jgi:hypothetical protein